jgi:chemotaxis protein CheC
MALNTITCSEFGLSALREVGNIGTGNAMTAFAELVDQRTRISVPDVEVVPLQGFVRLTGGSETVTVGAYMRVDGDAPGHVAILWPEQIASQLAAQLLGRPVGSILELDELERSALMEAGNILASSYLVAISNLTGLLLLASPISMAVDMTSTILSAIGAEVALEADEAFVILTRIGDSVDDIGGYFIFIPETGSLPLILRALQVEC